MLNCTVAMAKERVQQQLDAILAAEMEKADSSDPGGKNRVWAPAAWTPDTDTRVEGLAERKYEVRTWKSQARQNTVSSEARPVQTRPPQQLHTGERGKSSHRRMHLPHDAANELILPGVAGVDIVTLRVFMLFGVGALGL